MAKTFLTADETLTANLWFKTVFFPYAKDDKTQPSAVVNYWYESEIRTACKELYKTILENIWDTQGILDQYLNYFKVTEFLRNPADPSEGTYSISGKDVANFIANLCSKQGIYWDDSIHTSYELEYFKKTILGKALWNFNCFVSQEDKSTRKLNTTLSTPGTSTTKATTPNPTGTSTTSTGSGHTLNLSNAGGVVSIKVMAQNSDVYWIGGSFVNAGKTQPRLHVSPQGQSAPLKVKYGSGQGYNDCLLYFDSLTDANDFYNKAIQKMPSNVSSLMIKKVKADPNGYFLVNTEFGEAAIKASKLHEELIEETVTEEPKDTEYYLEQVRQTWDKLNEFMK